MNRRIFLKTSVGALGTLTVLPSLPRSRPRKKPTLPKHEYSLVRAIRSLVHDNSRLAPLEHEVSSFTLSYLKWEPESRDGLFVPVDILGKEFAEAKRERVALHRAGCTWLEVDSSPVLIPTPKGRCTCYDYFGPDAEEHFRKYWERQDREREALIAKYGYEPGCQIKMEPHARKIITQISQSQISIANAALEKVMREDIASTYGLLVDSMAFNGYSCSSPFNTRLAKHQIRHPRSTTRVIDTDDLWGCLYELEKENVPDKDLAWFCHPKLTRHLKTLRVSDGRKECPAYIVGNDGKPRLVGNPIYETHAIVINRARLFVVHVPDVYIADWGLLRIEAHQVSSCFGRTDTELRITVYCDCVLRNDTSMVYLEGESL